MFKTCHCALIVPTEQADPFLQKIIPRLEGEDFNVHQIKKIPLLYTDDITHPDTVSGPFTQIGVELLFTTRRFVVNIERDPELLEAKNTMGKLFATVRSSLRIGIIKRRHWRENFFSHFALHE